MRKRTYVIVLLSTIICLLFTAVDSGATNYSAGWTSIALSNNNTGQLSSYTLDATNPSSGGSGCVNSCIPSGATITITFPAGTDATTAVTAGSTFGGAAIAAYTAQTATTLSFVAPASVAKGVAFTIVIQNITNPVVASYSVYTTLSVTAANVSPGTTTFSGGSSTYAILPIPAFVSHPLSSGWNHSLFICSDSSIQSWGQDVYGQLGDDPVNAQKTTPVAVANLTGMIAVAGGNYHSLAIKSNFTLWSWGEDTYGQLGDNASLTNQSTPVQVASLTGIIAVSAGAYHSLALKSDGTVWSWGWDNSGQLGDNAGYGTPADDKSTPVQVASLTNIIAVAAGGYHSLALKNDGTIWSWGRDNYGQLGDNASLTNQPTPVQVASLTGIIAIAAGYDHSLALKSDGTVWSWGWDIYGQLGDNASYGTATDDKSTPVAVASLTSVTAIAAGAYHSLALKSNNTIASWGWDSYGGLGDDAALANKPTFVAVASLTSVIAISAGWNHSAAMKSDSTVWSWGYDAYGSLGDDAALVNKGTPVQTDPLSLCVISALPVTLLNFNAFRENNNAVRCEWTTSSEYSSNYFAVERSYDGAYFKEIGRVSGAGNSTRTSSYSFEDNHPLSGINYYRLRQADYNEKYTYSNIVTVVAGETKYPIGIFPNPAEDELHIVPFPASSSAIRITNILGEEIFKQTVAEEIRISISCFPRGMYFLEAVTGEGSFKSKIIFR